MTEVDSCLQFDCLYWNDSKCRLSWISLNVNGECSSLEER